MNGFISPKYIINTYVSQFLVSTRNNKADKRAKFGKRCSIMEHNDSIGGGKAAWYGQRRGVQPANTDITSFHEYRLALNVVGSIIGKRWLM